jgi:hypothetical protein
VCLKHTVTREEQGVPVPSLVVVASSSAPGPSAVTDKSDP